MYRKFTNLLYCGLPSLLGVIAPTLLRLSRAKSLR